MRTLSLVLLSFIFFANSLAADIVCTGNVSTVAFGPTSGLLSVSNGYGVEYLCNFNQSYNGVDPRTCKAWYAMLLTAKASSKKISMHYDATTDWQCNQVGNWAVPNPFPYWVEIVD